MAERLHIKLKEHIPGQILSVKLSPEGWETADAAMEMFLRHIAPNLTSKVPMTLHGAVSGAGRGGGGFATLATAYFFITHAEIDGRVTVQPEDIVAAIPDHDQFVVMPWIAKESFSANDNEGSSTFIEMENQRLHAESEILGLFYEAPVPGSGVEIYSWTTPGGYGGES